MNKKHKNTRKGFTLLEILLVIAAIGILAAIVLVAINPNRQLEAARNAKRRADINTIQKAIQQYSIDNNGQYPTGIETGAKAICKGGTPVGCVDLSVLSPNYIASIPDPDSNYYYVRRSNNSIEVSHPRDTIWNIGGNPSLDLNFASNKSLIDSVSGNNLVTFTRASSGTYVGSDGVLQTATTNEPRFDHNPTTGESLGLLMEEQRTNLLLQSEDFSTTWTATGTTVTTNNVTGPAGATTADKLIESAGGTTHLTAQTFAVANATAYTLSVFAKAAERSRVGLYFGGAGGAAQGIIVNLTTGAFAANIVAAPTSYSIVPFPNGWYRISITATSTGTAANHSIYICDNTNAFSYSGDGTSGLYLWGAQLEVGAFPTSYIPTTTATATRNTDIASITGTNFLSWYNQTEGQDEGTVVVDVRRRYSGNFVGFPGLFSFDDGTANNRIHAFGNAGTTVYSPLVSSGGVTQLDYVQVPASSTGPDKIGLATKLNSSVFAGNGAVQAEDTSVTMPVNVIRVSLGASLNGSNPLNGTIHRLTYWPTRLSNTTLQNITR